jgi:hypothetical protein
MFHSIPCCQLRHYIVLLLLGYTSLAISQPCINLTGAETWRLTGNPGPVACTIPQLGTIANQPISFITNNTQRMRLTTDGKLGINTTTPIATVDVAPNSTTTATVLVHSYSFTGAAALWVKNQTSGSGFGLSIDAQGKGHIVSNFTSPTPIMTFDHGKVGIGTTSMSSNDFSLFVSKGLLTEKIKVSLVNDWPDYVLTPNYTPMSLAELEIYIKRNGHLPEVPTAREVERDGLDLAKINALLLKKMEELTLLIIDQEKRLNQLEQERSIR